MGRLAFEQLQNRLRNRLQQRGVRAARAAAEWPAHFVASDPLRLTGTDTAGWPYGRRRAMLECMFTGRRLSDPWALCPSTTDPDTVREWLTWASVGGFYAPSGRAGWGPGGGGGGWDRPTRVSASPGSKGVGPCQCRRTTVASSPRWPWW